MESILSKEHKSDKLAEDLNSRCNVFVQVRTDSIAPKTAINICFLNPHIADYINVKCNILIKGGLSRYMWFENMLT